MFENIDVGILFLVFISGVVAFTISTISGGGGLLMLIPFFNFLVGASKTAPIVNLGGLISRPTRILIFWKHIIWKVFWYYVPTAMLGAFIAAWWFTSIKIVWLQIFIALFLISTIFQYNFGKKEQTFQVKLWYFIPLGFLVSVIGTFTGGMGPVLNPFYLNSGITKESLIATKSVNSFFLGLAQISSYTFFGILTQELLLYGVVLGLGASIGNLIGKILLQKMTAKQFRIWVIAIMVVSGIVLLYKSVNMLL